MRDLLERRKTHLTDSAGELRGGPQRRLLRGYLHKTSNGLCGIKGYASLIAGGDTEADGAVRWAKKIIHEVERMEEIFRSVGDLSDHAAPAADASDLRMTVAKAIARGRRRHDALRVEIGYLPEGEMLLPAADLGMILDELLDNCAQAGSADHPEVLVRICGMIGRGDRIALIIEDDGTGIEPALLPQAAHAFVTTREGHLGIGLARIETLLDMYGLSWELTSEPGTGTTFTCEVGHAAEWNPVIEPLKRKAGNG